MIMVVVVVTLVVAVVVVCLFLLLILLLLLLLLLRHSSSVFEPSVICGIGEDYEFHGAHLGSSIRISQRSLPPSCRGFQEYC